MKHLIYYFIILLCAACASQNSETEKFYTAWDKVIDAKTQVHEINMDTVLINENSTPYIAGQYLLIADGKSTNKLIYVFDKNDFHYMGCFAHQGEGPKDITRIGTLGTNQNPQSIYITDYGKMKIFSCRIDSALTDSTYTIKDAIALNPAQFPSDYTLISDSIGIGLFIFPNSSSDYRPHVAKWNLFTGKCEPMPYEYPDIQHKRVTCGISPQNNIYAECYEFHDLMTLCDFSGKLICNIHGPNWELNPKKKIHYYSYAVFCKNMVIAAYSGGDNQTDDYYPTKFNVFDLEGNYLKTIDVGYKILRYCYDHENNRLIICFNDDIQYGYLDLKGLI